MVVEVIEAVKGQFVNYCYLIIDKEQKITVAVDPVWDEGVINQYLEFHGVKLIAILLTHHHTDHSFLSDQLARNHQALVFMSKVEIEHYNFCCQGLKPLEDEGSIVFGSIKIRVINTPGHTSGSLCYYVSNTNCGQTWLFSGDTLFAEGCGVCIDRGSSPEQLFDSLQKLKQICGDSTLIYPGHSFGLAVGQPYKIVRDNNIYLSITQKEVFVRFRTRTGVKNIINFK